MEKKEKKKKNLRKNMPKQKNSDEVGANKLNREQDG